MANVLYFILNICEEKPKNPVLLFLSFVMQFIERTIPNNYWITVLMVCIFVFLAFLRYLFPNNFNQWIFNSTGGCSSLKKEKNQGVFLGLLVVFQTIVFSLFAYLLFKQIHPDINNNEWFFAQLFIAIIVFLGLKWIIEKLIGIVFSVEQVISSYQIQKNYLRGFLAVFLFIGAVLLYFLDTSISNLWLIIALTGIGLYLLFTVFGYKSYKSLILDNFFYFILYLCALEISPYLILYKLLV